MNRSWEEKRQVGFSLQSTTAFFLSQAASPEHKHLETTNRCNRTSDFAASRISQQQFISFPRFALAPLSLPQSRRQRYTSPSHRALWSTTNNHFLCWKFALQQTFTILTNLDILFTRQRIFDIFRMRSCTSQRSHRSVPVRGRLMQNEIETYRKLIVSPMITKSILLL